MLDMMPQMTDAGAVALAKGAAELAMVGSAATGNLLRIVESDTVKAVVYGSLALVGSYMLFHAFRALWSKAPVHEVVHRGY